MNVVDGNVTINIPKSAIDLIKIQRTHHKTEDYIASITEEIEKIIPFIPQDISSVLSIGCGVAGAEAYLYNRLGLDFRLYCIDGDRIDHNKYGYSKEVGFYNRLDATRDMLEQNGVKDFVIGAPDHQVDVLMSLWSLAFHYPYDKYKDAIEKIFKPRIMILDIRKMHGVMDIPKGYRVIETITDSKRHSRVVLGNAGS